MKKFLFIILFFLGTQLSVKSQDQSQLLSCNELISFIEKNGSKNGNVSPIELLNSTWLKSVESYKYDDMIFVIAEIKTDEFSYFNKKYIFCDIPSDNWYKFYYGLSDLTKTYGERFHKYIIDYQCNCK